MYGSVEVYLPLVGIVLDLHVQRLRYGLVHAAEMPCALDAPFDLFY